MLREYYGRIFLKQLLNSFLKKFVSKTINNWVNTKITGVSFCVRFILGLVCSFDCGGQRKDFARFICYLLKILDSGISRNVGRES